MNEIIRPILAGTIAAFIAYWIGYFDGMKSKGKCQIRIGGSNNTQVMK